VGTGDFLLDGRLLGGEGVGGAAAASLAVANAVAVAAGEAARRQQRAVPFKQALLAGGKRRVRMTARLRAQPEGGGGGITRLLNGAQGQYRRITRRSQIGQRKYV
jgi:hypothetical protein